MRTRFNRRGAPKPVQGYAVGYCPIADTLFPVPVLVGEKPQAAAALYGAALAEPDAPLYPSRHEAWAACGKPLTAP